MDFDVFFQRLTTLFRHSGKKQREICDATGITTSTMSRLLSEPSAPDVATAAKLSKYFDVSIDWLLGLDVVDAKISEQANRLANYYDKLDESDKIIIQAVLAKYQ